MASSASPNPPGEPKVKEPNNKPAKNSSIWVTGLPPDTTLTELEESFTRWGGMIAKNIDTGRPRIKMYTDEEGKFTGESLISESVSASMSNT